MTCIVGLIDKDSVILGSDSVSTGGYAREVRKEEKVFRVGKFILGCTTSYRMIQLLKHSLQLPTLRKNEDLTKYMCIDFVRAVKDCFNSGGYSQKFTDGDDKGGTFLVAYENRLFKIEDDFNVSELECNYNACGCGADFALGSMFSTEKTSMLPEDRVLLALKSAAYHCEGVGEPFHLLRTIV